MNSSKTSIAARPSNRFRSRASLAGAGAFAAAATVAAPSLAQAQIIWSGELNEEVNSGFQLALLDLNGNSIPDGNEAYFEFEEFKGDPGTASLARVNSSDPDFWTYAGTPLAIGATVDSSTSFFNSGPIPGDLVPADGENYFYGFRYTVAGDFYYGWAEVSLATDRSFGTLHQWAYNSTSGAPITVGAIPEPSATALVGIATVAFACLRKRFRRA